MGICYALINKLPLRQILASFPSLLRSNESGEPSQASGGSVLSPLLVGGREAGGGGMVGVSDAVWVC